MRDCTNCPFFGLLSDKKCSVWGCTRSYCISDRDDSYKADDLEELAHSFGFETAQDMYEILYKINF